MKKFDKSLVQTHSDEEIKELKQFCKDNNILNIKREYYFTIGRTNYRLSPTRPYLTECETRYKMAKVPSYKKYVNIMASKWDLKEIFLGLKEGNLPDKFKDIPLPQPEYVIGPPTEDDLFNIKGYDPELGKPEPPKPIRERPSLYKHREKLKQQGLYEEEFEAINELLTPEKTKPKKPKKSKPKPPPIPVAEPEEKEEEIPVVVERPVVRKRPTKEDLMKTLLKRR